MDFVYDLIEIGKPMWGGIIFPEEVVAQAVADTEAICRSREASKPVWIPGSKGILELCRYELPYGTFEDDTNEAGHALDLKMSGQMLEVIGYVTRLWIEGGWLKCSGLMQAGLAWPEPLEHYTAIPYVQMNTVHKPGGSRTVKMFRFTEIVMVYQAVTKLALRKYSENKSILAIDTTARCA